MWQSAIAGCVGLIHATINRIFWRHAATGTWVPGKPTGAPRKTTPRQGHALLRMVWQDHFISARVLTAWMRNLHGMTAGRKTINNLFLSCGYHAYRLTRKPLLTANHHRRRLEWAQRCQKLTMAAWQHVQGGGGSVHVWGAFHSGAKLPVVLPDRFLSGELYSSILRKKLSAICQAAFRRSLPLTRR